MPSSRATQTSHDDPRTTPERRTIMPVTSIDQDPSTLTLTITADFSVSRQHLWDAYADPNQLEKFWGPPGWPATFSRHDFTPGGFSHYYMTGPDGETSGGYWEFVAVDAPHSFEVKDGFAQPDGTPNTVMPSMRMVFTFSDTDSGSRMVMTTYFNSTDELEQLLAMGMLEGTKAAMGQIDDVLADLTSFAHGHHHYLQQPVALESAIDPVVQ